MKRTRKHQTRFTAVMVLGLGLAATAAHAQHINAGALSTTPGSQLYFNNALGFMDSSGFVITNKFNLTLATSGTYAGYYNLGNPSFTALAQTSANGATPSPNAAAFGSFLELSMLSVNGPAGGMFSFWDEDATSPTYSLNSGGTATTFLIDLSDASLGAGASGADPFGHIHGRRWTATVPGDYTVTFRIFDTSINGPFGTPLHTPSGLYHVTFTAVPEPSAIALAMLSAAAVLVGFRRKA